MLNRIFLLSFLGLLLSSCVMPYGTVMKRFQDAPVCCKSMSQFEYEMLHIGDSKSFDLNEESDAFQFYTGKSYFKAFELPQESYPFHMFIKSYMLGHRMDYSYIFFPYIFTLDEEYHIVRSTVPSALRFKKAELMDTLKETGSIARILEGFVSFSSVNRNEKYLVILTTESLLQENIYETYRPFVPIILPGIVGALPGKKDVAIVPASPTGHVKVSLVPGIPKHFIAIDQREKSFTIFNHIPEENIDEVKSVIKGRENIEIVDLAEFVKNSAAFITSPIIRNEYEGSQIELEIVEFLQKYAGSPIGVTWNGGIAITNNDYEHAKITYQQYMANPEDYKRKKSQESPPEQLKAQSQALFRKVGLKEFSENKDYQKILRTQDIIVNAIRLIRPFVVNIRGWNSRETRWMSLGSGLIIDEQQGFIITNEHIFERATHIRVRLESGKEYEATVVGSEPSMDLALLKIFGEFNVSREVPLGRSDMVTLDEWVVAIGNPFGFGITANIGVVERNYPARSTLPRYSMKTTVAIHPGNSGGPVVNMRGEVIGISVAILPWKGDDYVIPVNILKSLFEDLKKGEKIKKDKLDQILNEDFVPRKRITDHSINIVSQNELENWVKKNFLSSVNSSVVSLKAGRGKPDNLGSGFIIDLRKGYILTNNNILKKSDVVKVCLSNGVEYEGEVIGRDQKRDLALIKISKSLRVSVQMQLGNSDELRVGEWAVAISNIFGLERKVNVGIIMTKGGVIGAGPYDNFLQTDANFEFGDGGGPLFNIKGEVIGINTAKIRNEKVGFAIPINIAKKIQPLLQKGKR